MLGTDPNGGQCSESFNYASVVGMLMYLSNTTRPDIAFAVHHCARYTHSPKRSYEIALQRIGRYLVGTAKMGMILKPDEDLNIVGIGGTRFSKFSKSGWTILVGGCPVLWASMMQTEIALSTMQADYVTLSTAMRDLIPFKKFMAEILKGIGMRHEDAATLKTRVHEDNNGALTLANLEPGRTTSRSKHFSIKYHWFREQLKPNNVEIVKVESKQQIADILTKGVTKDLFATLRKLLIGW